MGNKMEIGGGDFSQNEKKESQDIFKTSEQDIKKFIDMVPESIISDLRSKLEFNEKGIGKKEETLEIIKNRIELSLKSVAGYYMGELEKEKGKKQNK